MHTNEIPSPLGSLSVFVDVTASYPFMVLHNVYPHFNSQAQSLAFEMSTISSCKCSFLQTGINDPQLSITFTEHNLNVSHGNSIEFVFLFILYTDLTGIFTRSKIFNESSFK